MGLMPHINYELNVIKNFGFSTAAFAWIYAQGKVEWRERVDQLLVLELVVRNYILKKRWLCSEDMGI